MIPEPLPQVGAMLCLDTELSGDFANGSKYWKLAGSCVLVAPELVLTIGHILGEREQPPRLERYRAFLPYQGLLEFDEAKPPQWEPQVAGDNLALIRLKKSVEKWAPLPPRKVHKKEQADALVCGYGSWPRSFLGRLEGIQQQRSVRLPRYKDPDLSFRVDNLDLSWSASENNGLIPGRGNSGGPMLKLQKESPARSVIGILREAGKDQQAGSWITEQRWAWLKDLVQPQTPDLEHRYRLLEISGMPGELIPLEVPEGATSVRATLNASQGMRLQMGIVPADESAGLLQGLADDDHASGRFLCRTLDGLEGAKEIAIGVCPVARAPIRAKEVLAQLCVVFL